MEVIPVATGRERELVDISGLVAAAVGRSGLRDGLCHVFVPHTTAGIVINENADPDVAGDLVRALDAMLPAIGFRHAEGNSPAHLVASLVGSSVMVPVAVGKLALGRWQGIFLLEWDGPRKRRVQVTVLRQ